MPIALITGGHGDLAQALKSELTAQEYSVYAPGKAELDIRSADSVWEYIKQLGQLDLLVCNAGIIRDKPLLQMTAEDFEAVLSVNLTGHSLISRAALKMMSKQRNGHIVFISSHAALNGTAGQSNYAASKAALHGLAASLAREYGSRNIRVNVVLPGFLETRMTAHLNDAQRENFKQSHVLNRFNDPASVARFIAFLDKQMPHTSGQVFNLDSRIHRWT
ncbi:SDR family oxidoreductase [Phragmitibacter flavus]|uniref:SDR family oxidoreductase n=1 Tax=Phragmitibacter flavus TaxID=2576071 RepID=A0A5R8KKE2_9BACT|nr:SDR family NAD(P)-dependent oxidoreductase [Phragmitibacter flavus]TLD72717.1 SDR family oxidoreductase [Phragmitibacter flavus]